MVFSPPTYKRAAVTGAGGFIGQRLIAELLNRGVSVHVLTRRPQGGTDWFIGCKIFQGDIGEPDGIPGGFFDGVDVFYHCAAELRDPSRMHAVNVDGTRQLAEAATGQVRRWVQLSSVGVYGPHDEGEITESTPMKPANGYEISKAAGDESVLSAAARGAFECVLLRPSIVFGPGMPNRSLFQLAAMIRRGLFFFVGPLGASANYVPVDNVVDALLLCGTHPAAAGRTYNLSDWATMEDFIAAMADALGVPAPRRRLPLLPVRGAARLAQWIPGSPLTVARVDALTGRVRYPTDRIEAELGYRHRQTLQEALNAMFREPSIA